MNKKVVLSVLATAVVASMATSAFAKPSQGLYIGGNIDKYYSITEFVTNEAAVINHINSAGFGNVLYVDDQGKAATITEIVNAADMNSVLEKAVLADFQGNTYTKSDGTTYDPSKDPDLGGATGELKVESVSAINSTEVLVKFGTKVDEDSAENTANYAVTALAPSAEGAKTIADVELQADGKSAIVRFGGGTPALVKNTVYSIEVTNVLSEKFEKIASYEGSLTVTQDAAPSLATAKLSGSNLNLTFNEQVSFANAIVKVDGVQVTAPFAATSTDAGTYEYAATVSGAAVATGTHTVTIVGLEDVAGNEAGTLTATYTVTDDVVAPAVSAITAVDSDTFKITFSEGIVAAPTVKTTKGTTVFGNAVVATAKPNEWLVNVNAAAGSNNLYEIGESSVNLAVEVTNYKDSADLLGSKYTSNVVLSADTTAPTVLSQNLNTVASINAGADTAITIKFSENVVLGSGSITVKDPDGIILTATPSVLNDVLTLTVAGHVTKAGTYTIMLGAGAVEDAESNGNAAVTTTATFEAATSVLELATGAASVTSTPVNGKVVNKINIAYGVNMDDSAIDLANYKLDNAALPAGSTIGFDGNEQNVVIILPDTFVVPAQSDFKFEISKNVKTAAGASVRLTDGAPTSSTLTYVDTLTLEDNKAPVLASAKLLLSGAAATTTFDEIELTFGENLAAVADDLTHQNDFVVTVNGINVTVASVTDGVAGDNKVVLSFGGSTFNASQVTKVKVATSGIAHTDVAGNNLTSGTEVTATK